MEQHYNWIHIDGDEDLMRLDPKRHHAWKDLFTCFEDHIQKDIPCPEELYSAYLDSLILKTEEARQANPEKTVCVAFALYPKSFRDYIRKMTSEPVSFVLIKVERDQIIKRNMPRVAAFCA